MRSTPIIRWHKPGGHDGTAAKWATAVDTAAVNGTAATDGTTTTDAAVVRRPIAPLVWRSWDARSLTSAVRVSGRHSHTLAVLHWWKTANAVATHICGRHCTHSVAAGSARGIFPRQLTFCHHAEVDSECKPSRSCQQRPECSHSACISWAIFATWQCNSCIIGRILCGMHPAEPGQWTAGPGHCRAHLRARPRIGLR